MLKTIARLGLAVVGAAWALSGCGSSPTPKPPIQTGALITFVGDSPFCDVLAFRPSISRLTLTPQGGGAEVGVLVSTNSFAPSIKVNLADLRDSVTILNVATVRAGTYEAATITFSNPQLVVYDPTQVAPNPPLRTVTVTLTNAAAKVVLNPALTINPPVSGTQQVSAMRLDFDLRRSIGVDATGQVTGTVTPVFVGTSSPSGSSVLGQFEAMRGFVQRVDTVSSNTSFIGDFQVQLLEGSAVTPSGAPSVLVNLTSTSLPLGSPPLNQIPTGSFVEINGYVDSKGNVVANSVDLQDRESVEQNKLGFIGYVLSVTKDSSGNLTQFNFSVHEEQPNPGFSVPLDSVVIVNTSSSTGYHVGSPSTNFANLSFSQAAIVPGQELIVHGVFTKPPSATPPAQTPPTTVAADNIYLKLQTHQGNFSSIVPPVGSDDKTGAFYLSTCATLLSNPAPRPVLVVTNNQTAFVNVGGLGELTPQPTLLIKGLPFYEPQATTVNGVAVPAGTLVIVAEEVHQLT